MITEIHCDISFQFEYQYDEYGDRVMLGRGAFDSIYAGRDIATNMKIAVKEMPKTEGIEGNEEIALHRTIHHDYIVQFIGSRVENGYYKIIMEHVRNTCPSWVSYHEHDNQMIRSGLGCRKNKVH